MPPIRKVQVDTPNPTRSQRTETEICDVIAPPFSSVIVNRNEYDTRRPWKCDGFSTQASVGRSGEGFIFGTERIRQYCEVH